MRTLLNKIFAAFINIGKDRYIHFAFGTAIASITLIAMCWCAWWLSLTISIVSVVSVALLKDLVIDENADYIDIICTIGGGVMVWLSILFNMFNKI